MKHLTFTEVILKCAQIPF